ncbi:hypothetical protein B0H15DRAFT_53355 [Mycena belliarum]|uniref:GST N-terminal domain-containing protein n=1 Tax=Mycena belliarum TaxID=1033014 RepID=A0AAD6UF33_9AGAR|nr:hypothetical protein B0H15DRAFT_53355 [Mycena belliae]
MTIIFYDIASGPPVKSFAPNPCKTRYALNFKGVDYHTDWVELPDVPSVRHRVGAALVRAHRDGSDFPTLPIIKDTVTGKVVGDSFDIAVYLDEAYPNGPSLLPPSTLPLQHAFNISTDLVFQPYIILLTHGISFNPETAERSKADFVWRAGVENWDQLTIRGEARAKTLDAFKVALGGLAEFYKRSDGPFMNGETPIYADFILGGWIAFMSRTLPVNEWEDIQTWQDGFWGRFHQALQKYAELK